MLSKTLRPLLVVGSLLACGADARAQVPNWERDPAFASATLRSSSGNGGAATVTGFVRQPDGKFLVSGSFDRVGNTTLTAGRPNFIRLNADGTLDASFRPPEATSSGGLNVAPIPVGAQPDGHIIILQGGEIRRLDSNGSPDAGFSPIVATQATLDASGNILALTGSTLARFSPAGTRDPGFTGTLPASSSPFTLGLRADGQVLFSNETGLRPSLSEPGHIARLGSGGSSDPSYAALTKTDGKIGFTLLPDGGALTCAEVRASSSQVPGVPTFCRLQRLDANGTVVSACDLPWDSLRIATGAHELLGTLSGGNVTANWAPLSLRFFDLAPNQITLLAPGPEIVRYRPLATGRTLVSLAPEIFVGPRDETLRPPPATPSRFIRPDSTVLAAQAYGRLPMTYQWLKNGAPISPAQTRTAAGPEVGSTFSILEFGATDEGEYTVVVTNAEGSARTSAQLTLLAVTLPPLPITVAPGQTVALTLALNGDDLSVRWTRQMAGGSVIVDESFVPNSSHTATLLLDNISSASAGTYDASFRIGNDSISTGLATVEVNVSPTAEPGRLQNLSVRVHAGNADQPLIVGFAVGGGSAGGTMPLLIRGIGPALGGFGVPNFLSDPAMTLRSATALIASNDDWSGSPAIAAMGTAVGAFALPNSQSKDAALVQPELSAGAYTVQVFGAGNNSGTALAEIYDGSAGARPPARLVNVSSRAPAAAGDPLIAGFVIGGGTAQTVLVRAVGPALAQFGVTDALRATQLAIFDSRGAKVAETAGRDSVTELVAARVGAFALGSASGDASLVLTLPPGAYTAQAGTATGTAGTALIEIYELR